jgi:hypothetical protein
LLGLCIRDREAPATSWLVSSRVAAQRPLDQRRALLSRQQICVSISGRTNLLEVLLQLGRQRAVEIIGNVGDAEEVLAKPALFCGG